jgi:phospholipid/cholesterol/gamma-HCH transport system permease protein
MIQSVKDGRMTNLFAISGRETIRQLDYIGRLNIQLWATLRQMHSALPLIGNRYRWKATVRQMLEIGVDALPMVALMAMCSGFILAMQGASELQRFGALHFVIELVTMGFTRELGPLITAIAVSGRSGSAFAAEIGTMKVTEEIDALKVMAFEPVEFVLAPKFLAALVTVPCLTIVTSVFGILAGGLFMFFSTHLGLPLYFRYVLASIHPQDLLAGLIKAVAFATIVVHVGCMEGLHVHGGPEAVGRSTTMAVVRSTFLIIVADTIFTTIFYFVGRA